jgi:hypothetical protein
MTVLPEKAEKFRSLFGEEKPISVPLIAAPVAAFAAMRADVEHLCHKILAWTFNIDAHCPLRSERGNGG